MVIHGSNPQQSETVFVCDVYLLVKIHSDSQNDNKMSWIFDLPFLF